MELQAPYFYVKSDVKLSLKYLCPNFPGSPVVKTPHFQCRDTGSIPDQRTKISHAAQCGQKLKSNLKKKILKPYNLWASQVAQWWRIFLPIRRHGSDPWVGKIPWRRKWLPSPVFLPGDFHGQRCLLANLPSGAAAPWTGHWSFSSQVGFPIRSSLISGCTSPSTPVCLHGTLCTYSRGKIVSKEP